MDENMDIKINISDYLLTPLSCSSVINEFIKCLIYQKCQIPYPYNWLKLSVNRRRKKDSAIDHSIKKQNLNFTIENSFNKASKLYDQIEEVMSDLSIELEKNLMKVVIVFGPTPLCPKEVCTIKIPNLAVGHIEKFHINEAIKHQHKVLRQIFFSSIWMNSIDSSIPCTNLYMYIIKDENKSLDSKHFKPCSPLNFSNTVKQYSVSINWEFNGDLCCKNLQIFNENPSENMNESIKKHDKEVGTIDCISENQLWYQYEQPIQGFKNCYINKTAVCDLW